MDVVHYGLGPIGLAVAALVAERPWLRSVGAVDVRPELVGRALGELVGRPEIGGPPVEERYGGGRADVALHCTGSSLERVAPQILELVAGGLNVVSTTEELSYPWDAHPALAAEVDAAARRAGVTVLGTGVNPGYAMDYLALALSAVAQRVDRVVVHRVQDAGTRRLPLQRKVGAGMELAAFRAAVAEGRVGHVGLAESAHSLARAFGWRLTELREAIEPLTAETTMPMAEGVIEPGQVVGLHQTAEGVAGGRQVIWLTLDLAIGIGLSRDSVRLHGVPDLELEAPNGVPGDLATAAIVVNAIPRVVAAPAGLAVMSDLAPPTPGPPPG
ncbi:MAG TPA: dihydrodipicolinate reductase [Candidatus Dormibacteraeota bacterium]|nr:dihydrodipicolinate reductase [Candidatus Dormibacteraeota bacterium]